MDYPLISIALCTYNGEKYLLEQLDSLINQTYRNIEIIAVDDCSSDCTLTILQQYASIYSQIKVYCNKENKGYSKNFEYAISLCQGDYIAISDQDDIWMLNKIELLLNNINGNLLIYSNSLLIDHTGNTLNKTCFDKCSRYHGGDPRTLALFNIFLGHSMLFKRDLINIAFPIPEHSTYDAWLGFVATNNNSICVLDEVVTLFRQHDNNTSKNCNGKTKREKLTLLKKRIHDFLTIPNLQYRAFFEELYDHVGKRLNNPLHIKLLLFLFKHRNNITLIFNTSKISKLNLIRKFYI